MRTDTVRLVGPSTFDFKWLSASLSDSYFVKTIDGLTAPDINVYMSDRVNDQTTFLGVDSVNREIVITLGLQPNYAAGQTVGDLRNNLYSLLPQADDAPLSVQLLNSGVVWAQTTGSIKKLENNPFSSDPEIQITIESTNPYLEAPTPTIVDTTSIDRANPVIPYNAQVSSHFRMELTITGTISSVSITQPSTGRTLTVTYAMQSGDILAIDSRPGKRGVWLTRNGTQFGLLGYTQFPNTIRGDSWFRLKKGNNAFVISTTSFNWNLITYTLKFWGI